MGGEFLEVPYSINRRKEEEKGKVMAKCPYCKKMTLIPDQEEGQVSFTCRHCGKIAPLKSPKSPQSLEEGQVEIGPEKNERTNQEKSEKVQEHNTDQVEEDEDEDEEDEEENSSGSATSLAIFWDAFTTFFHSHKQPLGMLLSFLLGMGMAVVYFGQTEPTLFEEEEEVVLPIPSQKVEGQIQSLSRILPSDAMFGATVAEITQENPDLRAMNSQETHFGLFQNGITLPLEEPVEVGNLFYFFDTEHTLQAVEFQIRSQGDTMTRTEVTRVLDQLTSLYEVVETGNDWVLWKGTDGFLAFHQMYKFLYVSHEEERVRSVLSSE